MGKEHTKDLMKFLKPYSKDVIATALLLREFVWDLYPKSNELIYDNVNAVAFGWSSTEVLGDTFCSIAVFNNKYVHFGFYWGSKISDPEKMLEGKGNQYRYIKVVNIEDFPKIYIKKLLKEAYNYSASKMKKPKEILQGVTIVKSISPTKKRPISPTSDKKKMIRTK